MTLRSRGCLLLGKEILIPFLVFVFLGSAYAHAGTIQPALEEALSGASSDQEIRIIVKVKGDARLEAIRDKDKRARRSKVVKALKKAAAQHPEILTFLKKKGIEKTYSLWIINSIALRANADVIRELAALPLIDEISLDKQILAPVTSCAPPSEPEWNIRHIGAPEVWNVGFKGQGIVVANMDTGVDVTHPDLLGRWRGGTNSWFDPNGEHQFPSDTNGHGTQTMGIMVGGDAGGSSIGVAPGAQWIGVKIFSDSGVALYSVIHNGFQWLLDPDGNPDSDDAADVVNNSWVLQDPYHGCTTEFEPDIQVLKAADIAVVFAAGNDGPAPDTSLSPSNYPESVAVGSVGEDNLVAYFSSRGPSACGGGMFPSLSAPGISIRTSDLNLGVPGAYAYVSGTSFAAPHVAGAIALLRSAFPDVPISSIEKALDQSATDLGDPGPDNTYGNGLVNVSKAYRLLKAQRIGVYLNGTWYQDFDGSASWDGHGIDRNSWFGFPGSVPIAGDWNAGGSTEVGIYDPLTYYWYLDSNGNGRWDGSGVDNLYRFGFEGTLPLAGDWAGNGAAKIGVYDPTQYYWYMDFNGNGNWDGQPRDKLYRFGFEGVVPVTGDWDGSGTAKIGVYDPAQYYWYVDYNGNGNWDGVPTDRLYRFGFNGAVPITGDWNGSGTAKIGVYDPESYTWYLDRDGSGMWDGTATDGVAIFGFEGGIPVVGAW